MLKRPKILIVGPNSALNLLIAQRLVREGFDIVMFSRFGRALEWATHNPSQRVGILYVAGVLETHLKDLGAFFSHSHHFPAVIAVFPKNVRKEYLSQKSRIDKVYTLPLSLRNLARETLLLLKSRGIPCMRKFKRHRIEKEILIRLSRHKNYRPIAMQNMSTGGFYVDWPGALAKVGDWVTFQIHPGDIKTPRIRGLGQVRWIKRDGNYQRGFGVEFTQLFSLKLWELERFIKEAQTEATPTPERFVLYKV